MKVGWRFENRLFTLTGEKLACDIAAAQSNKEKFKSVIEEMDLGPDRVYSADAVSYTHLDVYKRQTWLWNFRIAW